MENVALDAELESLLDPDKKWLQRAARLYEDSTDYYESSLFENWRSNIAHFRGRHADGSKYASDAYKHRSRAFRPKPRAAVRTLEATAAAALFTNDDLLSIKGANPNDPMQADAAAFMQALVQHRLEHTIPWFLTVVGAYQDTHVYGVCVSRTYWDFKVKRKVSYTPSMREDGTPELDEDGVPLAEESIEKVVVSDRPQIDLIAPENFRFDPGSDWRDPVGTSPYLIEVIPMFAGEVMAMADEGWREYTLGEIVAHGAEEKDSKATVRDAREGHGREDSTEVSAASEYSVVWVHRNIIRDTDGEDWTFYSLGTGALLTDPKPLVEEDPLGRSQYTVGISSIEAHRSHPSGIVELSRPLTELINDVTNQRLDNVKLVLNKRYKVRRGAKVDLGALMRNVPGGGVLMDDINADVGLMETPDVTQSSYIEQDRLAVETDELLGTFSQASVGNNRALNETVGGMNIMAQGANQVQELGLRTFIETWVEPVLRAVIKLESLYETDETIISLAADKADIEANINDDLMMQDLVLRVNVGMGNTNPQQKLARFLEPLNAAAQFPEFIQEMDFVEIGKEVFALAGQGDGSRFMLNEEKKQERMQAQQGPDDPRIVVEQMRMEAKQIELEVRQLEKEQDAMIAQMRIESEREVSMAKLAAEQEIRLEELYQKLGIEQQSLETKRQLEQARIQTQRDIAALRAKYDALKTRLQSENLARGYDTF